LDPQVFIDQYIIPSTKHRSFYHFTDGRNVDSILKNGILSARSLEQEKLKCVFGGNQWSLDADKHYGMDAYVHLCFMTGNSMEYLARNEGRIKSVKYFEVSPEVLKIPGALISIGVSNSRGAKRLDVAQGLDELDGEVIYRKTQSSPDMTARWRFAHKCEILIPDRVGIEFITGSRNG
jgi:hypothetical protein